MDRASVECFDPETEEWTLVAEMEKPRSGLVLMAIDHYIYAFGGRCRHTDRYFDIVERYNTVTRQWNNIASMNTSRAWPGVTVFDGRIYVLGGFDGSCRLRTAEMYDPDTDQWTYISSMIIPRAGCSAAVV
ncbi:kelch-like protein 5 [Octopus sinensis]|nr:kelch-like protein 5 [Octopus sinensis]